MWKPVILIQGLCLALIRLNCYSLSSLQLLNKNPKRRIGSGPQGAEDVKERAFFMAIDWDALKRRKLQAPFIPTLKPDNETSNQRPLTPPDMKWELPNEFQKKFKDFG
ncbi:hypothetical protein XENTR_v10012093 [Xenopus tropicalis]|nr:hypothetical protein XENTR_v10012093 [Xenopus tropicalis]